MLPLCGRTPHNRSPDLPIPTAGSNAPGLLCVLLALVWLCTHVGYANPNTNSLHSARPGREASPETPRAVEIKRGSWTEAAKRSCCLAEDLALGLIIHPGGLGGGTQNPHRSSSRGNLMPSSGICGELHACGSHTIIYNI